MGRKFKIFDDNVSKHSNIVCIGHELKGSVLEMGMPFPINLDLIAWPHFQMYLNMKKQVYIISSFFYIIPRITAYSVYGFVDFLLLVFYCQMCQLLLQVTRYIIYGLLYVNRCDFGKIVGKTVRSLSS